MLLVPAVQSAPSRGQSAGGRGSAWVGAARAPVFIDSTPPPAGACIPSPRLHQATPARARRGTSLESAAVDTAADTAAAAPTSETSHTSAHRGACGCPATARGAPQESLVDREFDFCSTQEVERWQGARAGWARGCAWPLALTASADPIDVVPRLPRHRPTLTPTPSSDARSSATSSGPWSRVGWRSTSPSMTMRMLQPHRRASSHLRRMLPSLRRRPWRRRLRRCELMAVQLSRRRCSCP